MLYDVIRDSTKLKEALRQAYMAGATVAGTGRCGREAIEPDFEQWFQTLTVTERGVSSAGADVALAWD